MAGNPVLNNLIHRIAHQEGGEDAFFQLVIDERMKTVAQMYGVSIGTLYRYVGKTDELRARFDAARRSRADIAFEESADILDDLADGPALITSQQVQLATARSKHRQWVASVLDPDRYGDKKNDVKLTIDLGAQFMAALRERGRVELPAVELPADEVKLIEADFEIEDESGSMSVAEADTSNLTELLDDASDML